MKPNLNDEKMDDKSIADFPGLQGFQPNIFADVKAATSAAPILDGGIPTQTNEGKYVCLCKKSYAHRSSYYKHTSTCLQFQHRQSVNKLAGIPSSDSSINTVSVSIISTTTTTTTATMTVPLAVRIKKLSTSQAAAPFTQSRPSTRASSASLKANKLTLILQALS